MNRNKRIIRISTLGIIVNIILVIFKSIVGLATNSIAIILDAVNNLSDVLSSVITIIGTKLSQKRPNKKHPYGYGRIEYFSSIIIAMIVLMAGVTSFKESFDKIINPIKPNYSHTSLVIIIVAILVKYFLGSYVKKEGNDLNSGSLVASGTDAISDSVLSLSTLIAAIINLVFKIALEGYLGIIISIMIIKTALEILKDTIDKMIGIRTDSELTKKIKKIINSHDKVKGVYDLSIHSYGPNKIVGSAHIQVDDNLCARDIHRLTRKIEIEIYTKLGIILTIGIYASNEENEYKDIKQYINNILKDYKNIISIHGFYVDDETKYISFDLIFNFDEENPEKCAKEIEKNLKEKYPEYLFSIIIDADISD